MSKARNASAVWNMRQLDCVYYGCSAYWAYWFWVLLFFFLVVCCLCVALSYSDSTPTVLVRSAPPPPEPQPVVIVQGYAAQPAPQVVTGYPVTEAVPVQDYDKNAPLAQPVQATQVNQHVLEQV